MYSRILFLFLFTVVVIGACTTDECKKVKCQNNGNCDNGQCICPDGFEGKYCETAWRDKFFGIYSASESCSASSSNYTITISANSSFAERINIYNIGNTGLTVVAIVQYDNFSIVQQAFGSGQISGSGSIGTNTISISYSYTSGTGGQSCSVSCLKQ